MQYVLNRPGFDFVGRYRPEEETESVLEGPRGDRVYIV